MSGQSTHAHANEQPECRPVVGFPGYRVWSDGRVETARVHGSRSLRIGDSWRPLTARPNTRGYPYVTLMRDRRRHPVKVHVIVLTAFVGPKPAGMECRHLDGDQTNSRLDNLCWGTPKENAADRDRHGRTSRGERCSEVARESAPRGEACSWARLTDDTVRLIRRLVAERVPKIEIARRLGVARSTVQDAASGRRWSHVQ